VGKKEKKQNKKRDKPIGNNPMQANLGRWVFDRRRRDISGRGAEEGWGPRKQQSPPGKGGKAKGFKISSSKKRKR